MNKRFLALGSILLVALLLVCCALSVLFVALFFVYQGTANVPPSASMLAADLRVIDQREVDIEGDGTPLLSPDGRWLAVAKEGALKLCIYAADSLTEQRCVELESGKSIHPHSFTWSPDSKRIALTENHSMYLASDLWVLDVETGRLLNLTDSPKAVNTLPVWSPDGKTLAFYRIMEKACYRVPANGGTSEKLLTMERAFASYLFWLGDNQIVYSTASSGLWLAEQQIVGNDPKMGPPTPIDVSPRGDKALILYRHAGARDFFGTPNVSYCALVDLQAGTVEPLKQATGDVAEFYGPMNAVFSPEGSKILYVYRDVGEKYLLAVRDLDGGMENVLLTREKPMGHFAGIGRGLRWAENGTIYVDAKDALLLSLGRK
jgi:dipeptidyl aminopeptidase/acylaminoacyl peptidase